MQIISNDQESNINIKNLHISNSDNQRKTLLIDGNNVIRDFMDCICGSYYKFNKKIAIPHENRVLIDLSNLVVVEERVKKFLEKCKDSFDSVKVFYDVNRKSDEVIQKYKSRREYDIIIEFRGVLYGHSIVLADMFKKYGAEINYCYDDDADDTIASFASNIKNSVIYSRDKDFMRYKYKNIPEICSGIEYKNNKLIFKRNFKDMYNFINGNEMEAKYPVPKTSSDEGKIRLLKNTKLMMIGVPTELCKKFGNFGAKLKILRKALYYYVFGNYNIKVKEVYPEWNEKLNKVEWIEDFVEPSKKYLNMLKYNTHEAFKLVVSDNDFIKYKNYIYSKYKDNTRNCLNTKFHKKCSVKEIAFNNCYFSLYCSVIALHCFVNNNASFLDKIYEIYFKKLKCDFCNEDIYLDLPSYWKKRKNRLNLITCNKCSNICFHYRSGYCNKGKNCKFEHKYIDFKRACNFGDNCRNDKCMYNHRKRNNNYGKYYTKKKKHSEKDIVI